MRHTHKLRMSVFRTAKDSLLCAKRRRIEPQYATFCNLNRKRPNINKLRFTQEKRGKRVAPMAQTGRAIACRRGRCECSQAAARLAHGPRPKPSSSRRTDTGSQSACPCEAKAIVSAPRATSILARSTAFLPGQPPQLAKPTISTFSSTPSKLPLRSLTALKQPEPGQ